MGRKIRHGDSETRDWIVRIAVTGATGFIGRHVVAELEQRSLSPVLVCRPTSRVLPKLAGHEIVTLDISDPPADAFDRMGRPDMLIHLAWGGLPHYHSVHHFEVELQTQYRFLKGLVERGLSSLLVSGTCAEYGMQSGKLSEDIEPRQCNPYGFAKHTLRIQLQFLQQSTPFRLIWARLFYLFGEGQSMNSLLPQLRNAVEQGATSYDMSGGEQLRDYLPVTTAARHLVSLALCSIDAGCVNVCSGTPISIRRLAEEWIKENNWPLELNFGRYPYSEHEPMAFWGDPTRLRKLLGTR
jgi:dTDP-6-deoxy-L-talose 4-dehydrogenase (NAD+)